MITKHITEAFDTWANILSGMDDHQCGIDTTYNRWAFRVGSNFYINTPDKYWNGAAYVYNSLTFNNLTVNTNLTVAGTGAFGNLLSVYKDGGAAIMGALSLTNAVNPSAGNTSAGASIDLKLVGTEDSGSNYAVETVGKIIAGKDSDFYGTDRTDFDSNMQFQTMLNGSLGEVMRLSSAKEIIGSGAEILNADINDDVSGEYAHVTVNTDIASGKNIKHLVGINLATPTGSGTCHPSGSSENRAFVFNATGPYANPRTAGTSTHKIGVLVDGIPCYFTVTECDPV